MHRIGGLEKDYETSAISTDAANHQKMVTVRQAKVDYISNYIPDQKVEGDQDAELLIVGWGGTYGHLYEAMEDMQDQERKLLWLTLNLFSHFRKIRPKCWLASKSSGGGTKQRAVCKLPAW